MDIDLENAVALLALPREIGRHPEDGEPVEAGVGRYGPYVKHGRTYASLTRGDEVLAVGMNRAVELLAQKAARKGGRAEAKPLRELGEHPEGGALNLMSGRYGPYVKWNGTNATLPKGSDPESLTREQALELVEAKRKTGKGKSGQGTPGKGKSKAGSTAKSKSTGKSNSSTKNKSTAKGTPRAKGAKAGAR